MKKRSLSALLLSLLVFSSVVLPACGQAGDAEDTTVPEDTTVETTAPEVKYQYPTQDFGGYVFKILNFEELWACNMRIDFESQTGEPLNDAIYERNRKVEEELGIKIEEVFGVAASWNDMPILNNMVIQSVMAGDKSYDAAYILPSFKASIVTEGYLYDLASIEEIKLNEDYWDKTLNDSLMVNGKLYVASSPLNLMTLDMAWCFLFNKTMMDNLGMDYPYQLVRDGKWTLDKYIELAKQGANLNGEETFKYTVDGSSIFGMSRHFDSIKGFIYSADNHVAVLENDDFVLNFETERMHATLEKLAIMFDEASGMGGAENGDLDYLAAFRNSRALFTTAELKASLEERDMKDNFGLVPFPKFDEDQKDYMTAVNQNSLFLSVPVNVDEPSRVGLVLDMLSFESNKTLPPLYYDVTISQKGLRDEDSIDMLEIIKSTRGIELSQLFGITTTLYESLATLAKNNTTEKTSSTVASAQALIEKNVEKFMEFVNK